MINLPATLVEQFEIDRERYIPYAGHIAPDVVMLTKPASHSIMAMLHLTGTPFELETNAHRNGRFERINTLLRMVGDTDLTIALHLVRHKHAPPRPQPVPKGPFVKQLMADYHAMAVHDLFVNDWFVSVVVHPFKSERWRRRRHVSVATDRQRRRLEEVVYQVQTTLADYRPKRLGTTDIDGMPVTEIGTALHLIRTGIHEIIPHTSGLLSSAIYREPAVFWPTAFLLNKPGVQRVGSMIGLNNYPALPRVGMFNSLLSAPYSLVMTHIFRFLSVGMVVSALRLVRQQMENANDAATDLADGLEDAARRTAGLKEASGLHHFTLAVYADNLPDLDTNVAHATGKLSNPGGAAPTREMNLWYNGAQESAYYAQFPGSSIFMPRPGKISTKDLAAMASLDAYPQGAREGYWGPSPIRFRTNGGTAYDFITHDEDVGHALVIGRIGSGKTVLLGMMAAALEPVMGANGIRLIIDKDEANRLLVEQAGGTYRPLRRNEASGLAPLVAYDDTPKNRAFFHSLYTWLIGLDGRRKLTRDEDGRLMRGITRQLKLPAHKRSMGDIRQYLGFQDDEHGAGARFERWCEGGTMGWLLDNKEHTVQLDAGVYGFDFTDLIPREGTEDDGACTAAAAVIMHQLASLMDGRRIAAFFDECRFYMEPLRRMIEDYTLTGRKKELMCWLVAQQPEHFTDTTMGMSLVSQMRTKFIFPDASHSTAALQKLQISEAAIRMLKTDMTLGKARRFLLWRQEPVVCEFDLSELPQLPILAGRAGTIRLMERVRSEVPADEVEQEFYRRLANIQTQRMAA